MSKGDPLADYRAKRNVVRSGEPPGKRTTNKDRQRFVIQRHDASSLHFDFRLEIAGVLVSWAVPKGPSTDPREKRLATRTEDHPLEYLNFEGLIPEGYGAGTVVVWDIGTYQNLTKKDNKTVPLDRALADGHIKVELKGHKLSGGYALTRTNLHGNDRNWLLVKVVDAAVDRRRKPVQSQPESVLTGRTNDDIGSEQGGRHYS